MPGIPTGSTTAGARRNRSAKYWSWLPTLEWNTSLRTEKGQGKKTEGCKCRREEGEPELRDQHPQQTSRLPSDL